MKSILKAVFVIIGTTIGAGFASGQEIYLFFNSYGNWGILGMLISCSLSGILIYQIFRILQKENINNYAEFLTKINHKKVLNQAIAIIISVFLLISFYIMIAGMSAYFKQELGIPTCISAIVMTLICYITLQRGTKGIVIVNSILIPCLILFICYLGFRNITFSMNYFQIESAGNDYSWNWIFSSVLYASYNSILLIPILIELKTYVNSKKGAKRVSLTCTVILTLLGICLFCLLLRNPNAYQFELPMIGAVKDFGEIYSHIYGAVVVVAIFTSAISAGYGFLQNEVAKKEFIKGDIEKRRKCYYQKLLVVICILAPVIANFGFANLVSILYPIFGILGLLQMILIGKSQFTSHKL